MDLSHSPPIELMLEGAQNFREVGGYPSRDGRRLRRGAIWRSAKLDELSTADLRQVAKLQLALIADLRQPDERAAAPTPSAVLDAATVLTWDVPFSGGHEVDALSGGEVDKQTARGFVARLYRDIPKRLTGQLGDMYRAIALGGFPILIHCSAGKDRTGVAIALLLDLLGIDHSAIIRDYERTVELLDWKRLARSAALGTGVQARWLATAPPVIQEVLFDARPAYLEAALDQISRDFGSTEAFAEARLGLDAAMIAVLREQLLE